MVKYKTMEPNTAIHSGVVDNQEMEKVCPQVDTLPFLPKTIAIGNSVLLMDVKEAVRFFPNNTYKQVLHIFEILGIPFLYCRKRTLMFNVYSLEKVINYVTRLGGRGFAFPGSYVRMKGRFEKSWKTKPEHKKPLLFITEEHAAHMNTALIAAERLSTGPRATNKDKARHIKVLTTLELEKKLRAEGKIL